MPTLPLHHSRASSLEGLQIAGRSNLLHSMPKPDRTAVQVRRAQGKQERDAGQRGAAMAGSMPTFCLPFSRNWAPAQPMPTLLAIPYLHCTSFTLPTTAAGGGSARRWWVTASAAPSRCRQAAVGAALLLRSLLSNTVTHCK